MSDADVINHLLDVEYQAAEVLLEAQTQADSQIEQAKKAADIEFKKQYDLLFSSLEKKLNTEILSIKNIHSAEMKEYQTKLNNSETDPVSFEALMNKLLFAE